MIGSEGKQQISDRPPLNASQYAPRLATDLLRCKIFSFLFKELLEPLRPLEGALSVDGFTSSNNNCSMCDDNRRSERSEEDSVFEGSER